MQTDNKLLDDLARVATSALGTLQGVREEVEARLRDQFEAVLSRLDLVTREEFDAVKAMAAQARRENDALRARIEALEAAGGARKRSRARDATGATTVRKAKRKPSGSSRT
jgi:BMFP domain-containing protein YqiC